MGQFEASLGNLQMAMRSMVERRDHPDLSVVPGQKGDRIRLLRRYPGLLTAACQRGRDKDPSFYSRVFHRKATSKRVMRNIAAELSRRQAAELESELAHAS